MRIVFTDLDGTLLDRETYDCAPAAPTLSRMRREGVPVVFVTSKTRAETEYWRGRLENIDPYIVENGGSAFIPAGSIPGAPESIELGARHGDLVEALERASALSGCRVRAFHTMAAAEIAALTDLPVELAELAGRREYDEPFEILDTSRSAQLLAAIEAQGMRWTRGGRFHHITGANDKGVAVRALIDCYRRAFGEVRSYGLGDAPNDVPFLATVDEPLVVDSPETWREAVLKHVLREPAHR
jgi:mannosyl-3-phosphoglycerate phosphatase